jgi:hypothetical protein
MIHISQFLAQLVNRTLQLRFVQLNFQKVAVVFDLG